MKGWCGMTDIMKINVGPQHPSTHGVLHLVCELDGENVVSLTPDVGYLHRGLEKLAESRTYLQYLPMVDRVDYLGGFFTSYAYCSVVENLLGIKTSQKSEYLRVLCMELNRIASHLLWLGTFLLDLGASSPIFYCFRERDEILSIFEELTGQRMMYNYFTFGGVRADIDDDLLNKILKFIDTLSKKIDDYEKIITKNPIFTDRTVNKGVLTRQTALKFAITGPNLRASGCELDFRKSKPYSIYNELDFVPAVNNCADSFARYSVRIDEMRISSMLVKQCILFLKKSSEKVENGINPVNIKVPAGEYTSYVESSRGLLNCYIKSDGTDKPYRVKWRTGSFYAVQLLPELIKGSLYQDLIAIFGSLDVILPEVDR